ncbi:YadA-like, C-terminal [Paracoccaceae bacterium]
MPDRKWTLGALRATGVLLAGVGLAGPVWADQVIADDLIVQSSICVGFDCVDNESFGFDTIRIKENNTRIFFDDTSVGSFPANDWQLVANDSASGGSSYFAIVDATAGQTVFRVCAVADTTCTNIMPTALDPQTALNTTAIAQNTTDIAANTTAIAQNTTDIAQNTSDIAAINTQIGGFADDISANRDGVAMAIALGGIAPLMPDQNGTIAFNVGHFNGASALGLAGGFRLDDGFVLNSGLGYASGSQTVGGRLGVQYSW